MTKLQQLIKNRKNQINDLGYDVIRKNIETFLINYGFEKVGSFYICNIKKLGILDACSFNIEILYDRININYSLYKNNDWVYGTEEKMDTQTYLFCKFKEEKIKRRIDECLKFWIDEIVTIDDIDVYKGIGEALASANLRSADLTVYEETMDGVIDK